MLKHLEGRRSWITQRMANAYPRRSRIRRLAQSIGQQILNPAAAEMEDLYFWEFYNLGNYLLNTTDMHEIENMKALYLPPTFEFQSRGDIHSQTYIAPSSVRGLLDSGTWIDVSPATNNKLEELWYGVPNRITAEGTSTTYHSVLPPTEVELLSTVVPTAPFIPSKLWVSLFGMTSSVKIYHGTTQRSRVEIRGYDAHDKLVTEKLIFPFDGTIQTRTTFAEVTSISTEYVDSSAFVQVEWLNNSSLNPLDSQGVHISPDGESVRFFGLSSNSAGSTLQHLVFTSPDFLSIEEGDNDKQSVHEIELLDASESNIDALGMSLWPKRRWMVITDGTTAHFFVPNPRIDNTSPLLSRSNEPILQIYAEKEFYCRDESIELDYNLTRPFFRILKTRWSVLKPSGERVGLDSDGAEIPYDNFAWVENPPGYRFMKLGLAREPVPYTLTQRGQYVFYLEALIADDLNKTPRYAEQVDVRVVFASYDIAAASVSLPISVGTAALVCFDAYARPWVINDLGEAHLLTFHHDQYVTDFQSKVLYLRENYSKVEVKA